MKVSNGHLGDPEHPPCDRKAYALGIPHATVKEPSPSVPKSENARLARSALEDGLPGISQMAQASHLGKRVFADSLYSAQPHSNADVSPFGSARPLQAPLKAAGSRKTAPETRKAPPRVYRDGAFCKEARVEKRFRGTEGSSTRNCEPRQGKQRSRSTECARPG